MPDASVCRMCGAALRGGSAVERICVACLLEAGLPPLAVPPSPRGGSLMSFLQVRAIVADGPFARVYLAQWTLPDGGFAVLKRSRAALPFNPAYDVDANRLLTLDHPHVATVFDLGRDADGHLFSISEYAPGTPLPEYWRRANLGPVERLELLRQTADTLAYLHACGLAHSNLKPTNVLVLDAPVGVKLLDFDAAMPHRATAEPSPDAVPGPERDMSELGALISAVLAEGGCNAETEAELRRISWKAVATPGRERYRTVHDMAADLTRCLGVAAS